MKKIIIILFCFLNVLILVGCNKESYRNFVVEEIDGQIVKGKDAMDAFYEQTKNGEKLRLNYLRKYKIDGIEKSYTFYIKYDGTHYITNYKMYTNSPEETKYKYLVYSEEQGKKGSNIEKFEYYCLSNNENHTYQIVRNSWLSAILDRHIDDAMPFYAYEYYKDGFKLGSYSCSVSLDGTGGMPTITFNNSREYSMLYSLSESSAHFGKYEIDNGYVYLIQEKYNNDQEIYEEELAFKIELDKLVFDIERSSVISWVFSNGTEFYYNDMYADDVKYKLDAVDNYNILLEPLNDEYRAGDIVKVKLQFFSGCRAGIKVNDELIERSISSKVWEYEIYEFIMPNTDVTLYTTINGYIESSNKE